VFFRLSSWELGIVIFFVVGGASALGVFAGRYLRAHSERYREPIGVLQGALLGVVGLILAFGLSLAVGRYQDRRADVSPTQTRLARRTASSNDAERTQRITARTA
jgi:hypothetical protein